MPVGLRADLRGTSVVAGIRSGQSLSCRVFPYLSPLPSSNPFSSDLFLPHIALWLALFDSPPERPAGSGGLRLWENPTNTSSCEAFSFFSELMFTENYLYDGYSLSNV